VGVPQHDGLRFLPVVQRAGRALQDRLGSPVLAEDQVTRAGQPVELGRREQVTGHVARFDPLEARLGRAERTLAACRVAEHGVSLGDVQKRQTGQHVAGPAGRVGRLLRQGEPGLRVALAVQGNEALAQQRVTFGGRIAHLPGSSNRLVIVGAGRGVVASLRGVPHQLAHQRRALRLDRVQLAAHPSCTRLPTEEGHLAQALSRLGQQRG
jgi:hypothetical protein